jgi:putative Holliday junction resolvase
MGLDVGDKRIGISISDPSFTLATPLKTILREKDDKTFTCIINLTEKFNVSKLVIGLPFSLDGSIGKQAEKVILFKDQLAEHLKIEILMQDERLSSVTADQRLREAGKKGDKLKQGMDAAAATVILQSYLDMLDHGRPS